MKKMKMVTGTDASSQIADTYWHLHTQAKSVFTYEIGPSQVVSVLT